MCYIDFQKRDGASILTSSEGDKSSLTKSTAPSTPIGESVNFHAEPRISNSFAGENVSADLFSIGHGEFPSGSIHGEEIPLVRFFFLLRQILSDCTWHSRIRIASSQVFYRRKDVRSTVLSWRGRFWRFPYYCSICRTYLSGR